MSMSSASCAAGCAAVGSLSIAGAAVSITAGSGCTCGEESCRPDYLSETLGPSMSIGVCLSLIYCEQSYRDTPWDSLAAHLSDWCQLLQASDSLWLSLRQAFQSAPISPCHNIVLLSRGQILVAGKDKLQS